MLTRNQVAARAAQELVGAHYVNLGIGLPTLIPNYLPDGAHIAPIEPNTVRHRHGQRLEEQKITAVLYPARSKTTSRANFDGNGQLSSIYEQERRCD